MKVFPISRFLNEKITIINDQKDISSLKLVDDSENVLDNYIIKPGEKIFIENNYHSHMKLIDGNNEIDLYLNNAIRLGTKTFCDYGYLELSDFHYLVFSEKIHFFNEHTVFYENHSYPYEIHEKDKNEIYFISKRRVVNDKDEYVNLSIQTYDLRNSYTSVELNIKVPNVHSLILFWRDALLYTESSLLKLNGDILLDKVDDVIYKAKDHCVVRCDSWIYSIDVDFNIRLLNDGLGDPIYFNDDLLVLLKGVIELGNNYITKFEENFEFIIPLNFKNFKKIGDSEHPLLLNQRKNIKLNPGCKVYVLNKRQCIATCVDSEFPTLSIFGDIYKHKLNASGLLVDKFENNENDLIYTSQYFKVYVNNLIHNKHQYTKFDGYQYQLYYVLNNDSVILITTENYLCEFILLDKNGANKYKYLRVSHRDIGNVKVRKEGILEYKDVLYSTSKYYALAQYNILSNGHEKQLILEKNNKLYLNKNGSILPVPIDLGTDEIYKRMFYSKNVIYALKNNVYEMFTLSGELIGEFTGTIYDVVDSDIYGIHDADNSGLVNRQYRDINIYNFNTGKKYDYREYKYLRFKSQDGALNVSIDSYLELYYKGKLVPNNRVEYIDYNEMLSIAIKYNYFYSEHLFTLLEKIFPEETLVRGKIDLFNEENLIHAFRLYHINTDEVHIEHKWNEQHIKIYNIYIDILEIESPQKRSEEFIKFYERIDVRDFIRLFVRDLFAQYFEIKRYLKLFENSILKKKVYINRNLVFYNHADFSMGNRYLAVVGKPGSGGYIALYNIANSSENVYPIIEIKDPRYAVWRGCFNVRDNFIAYDSTPDLYIYNMKEVQRKEDNSSNYFGRKINLNEVSFKKYIVQSSVNLLYEFIKYPNRSLLAISKDKKYVAFGDNSYEAVSSGGIGHIKSMLVEIYDTTVFPYEHIETFSNLGAYADPGESAVRSKTGSVNDCVFSENSEYLVIRTDDGIIHIKKIQGFQKN